MSGRALIIVLSQAVSDPRVRHQVTWLVDDGWQVDTVGIGPMPSAEVHDHFPLDGSASWTRTRAGAVVAYGLLPRRTMFRALTSNRIPLEARERITRGHYDLIVFDDTDFIPLIDDPRVFTASTGRTHVHLDIHEYREKRRKRTPWRVLTHRYYTRMRSLIGSDRVDSRTTVARQIAAFYAEDFGIDPPVVVRNSPPFVDQKPSPVSPARIQLVFHGLASWARGFEQILDALRALDERFTMTFMLTGPERNIQRLRDAAADLGERVRIVPPVPMPEIATEINQYDLAVLFYPPVQRNVEFALPNKFFEAVQGRLGFVVGESPMMAELVEKYAMGRIVRGWASSDLAEVLATLTAAEVESLKANADRAAHELNAELEGKVFLSTIAAARRKGA